MMRPVAGIPSYATVIRRRSPASTGGASEMKSASSRCSNSSGPSAPVTPRTRMPVPSAFSSMRSSRTASVPASRNRRSIIASPEITSVSSESVSAKA